MNKTAHGFVCLIVSRNKAKMTNQIFLVAVLCLTVSLMVEGFLVGSCPPNCARCAGSLGCTQCNAGFCAVYKSGNPTICMRNCPSGSFCNVASFCQNCRVDNCKRCSSANNCDECDFNYYLRASGPECVRAYECERFGRGTATTRNGIRVCE